MKKTFDRVCTISSRFKLSSDGYYQHRDIACWIATLILVDRKNFLYFSLNTGNGKTFIMLLVAVFLIRKRSLPVVYVTLNEALKR
jgi:DNA replication protein DnaC